MNAVTTTKLFILIAAAIGANCALAADLKMIKIDPATGAVTQAVTPVATPVALPANQLPVDGAIQIQKPAATLPQTTLPAALPNNGVQIQKVPATLPSSGVQIQKAPMALPQANSPAALPNAGVQAVKPVGNFNTLQGFQIKNKKWEDVQNMPDNTVLVTPDGQQTTVGDVKQYKQNLAKNNVGAPIALQSKSVKLQVKNNNQFVNIKAILAAENAAAAAAITTATTPTTGLGDNKKIDASNKRISSSNAGLMILKECENGCVQRVNGKSGKNVKFTPGTADSAAKYTITGMGFGTKFGSLYLTGAFNKRPTLRVDTWRDDQITAYFEAGFSGEPDRENIGLVVNLPDGKQIASATNYKFYAARAQTTVQLDKVPSGRLNAESISGLSFQKSGNGYEYKNDKPLNVDFRGYTDVIDTTSAGWLKPGFEVVDAGASAEQYSEGAAYRSDKGCTGHTYTRGELVLDWMDGNHLRIKRPLNQLSMDPMGINDVGKVITDTVAAAAANYLSFGLASASGAVKVSTDCIHTDRRNFYHSQIYDVSLVIEGPAGFSPF